MCVCVCVWERESKCVYTCICKCTKDLLTLDVYYTLNFVPQIDRQLQTYLQRVEAVLGKGWENHVEGQKLKQDGDAFRSKLNTQQLFEDWKKRVESRQQAVQGRIFNIVSTRTRSGTLLKLQVNFAPETITLAKEVGSVSYVFIYMYSQMSV